MNNKEMFVVREGPTNPPVVKTCIETSKIIITVGQVIKGNKLVN